MRVPTIAVVVATRNRAPYLPELVAALEQQEGVPRFEAIFVDDGSTDDTTAVLEQLAAAASFPLTAIRSEGGAGPATARNLGLRAARAPLIAFTDDDCLPDREWLTRIVAALETVDLVQGRTVAPPEAASRGPFARIMVIERFSWKFETCNVGYRRAILEAVGEFDERFPAPFGEDCDLGWRALDAGATATWVPDAIVVHRVDTTGSRVGDWIASLRIARRLLYAPLMVKKHPGLRDHLFARWFYKPHHPLAAAAFLGAALAASGRRRIGIRALAAGCAVPWLVYRTAIDPRPARKRWLWAVLPMALVDDLACVAATAEGSLRYRTLLL